MIAAMAKAEVDLLRLRSELRASYETPEALAVYSTRAGQGLRTWEARLVRDYLPARGKLLVVGCGAGREAFALDALGYEVTGVDVSPSMVAAARMRSAAGRCDFRIVDGVSLPFTESEFDAATLWSQVISNVPTRAERLRFVAEVSRVVRPGGLISLSAHDAELTLGAIPAERIAGRNYPEDGDVSIREDKEGTVRTMHYFTEVELNELRTANGLGVRLVAHTDELGEAWGNVFVIVAEVPA